jgi:transposase
VIEPELAAKILRLAQVEHWPVGTIAIQLGVHHDAVERVLRDAGLPKASITRPARVDPYVPFIQDTWAKYPKLRASRLFHMCRDRGYVGSPDHFRHAVARFRPRASAEAFLRLCTLPGEEAQVDWGHFGHTTIGRARRPLVAFVMVLSYSRAIYLQFMLAFRTEDFLAGHQGAFSHFGGCARSLLYDNLKSAVVERTGETIRFNPVLLAFANHYRFEPKPVAVARGNEKGRVERAIGYARTSFFPARAWRDLADLNAQALAWCEEVTMERPWPQDTTERVRDAFARDQAALLALPENPFPVEAREEVVAGKTPYVRFDWNDYSIPHTRVARTLVVLATQEEVRVVDGTEVIARHKRSYGRHEIVEDAAHVADLVSEKRRARAHRGVDRLARVVPASRVLLERAAKRGESLGRLIASLLDLLGEYGPEALEVAMTEVLAGDAPHVHAVRQVLERNHACGGKAPAQGLPIPIDPRYRDLTVTPQALSGYDDLAKREGEKGGASTEAQGQGKEGESDERQATDSDAR